jgi:hypothetical protein
LDAGNPAGDGWRFAEWLKETHDLTARLTDRVSWLCGRFAVEEKGRKNRLAHVHFQDLLSVADRLLAGLTTGDSPSVHLNPTRVWARLTTAELLAGDFTTPVDVLLLAVESDIRTLIMDPLGQALMRELEVLGPCTLDTWACLSEQAGHEEIVEFCRRSVEQGLVALG